MAQTQSTPLLRRPRFQRVNDPKLCLKFPTPTAQHHKYSIIIQTLRIFFCFLSQNRKITLIQIDLPAISSWPFEHFSQSWPEIRAQFSFIYLISDMDNDFVISNDLFLRVKRESLEKHYVVHPKVSLRLCSDNRAGIHRRRL
jgi:hypothetical protein